MIGARAFARGEVCTFSACPSPSPYRDAALLAMALPPPSQLPCAVPRTPDFHAHASPYCVRGRGWPGCSRLARAGKVILQEHVLDGALSIYPAILS